MGLDTSTLWGKLLKNIEIGFKRTTFWFFRLSGKIQKADGEFDPVSIKKVLFIAHFKLGDMIVSLPVYFNLRKRHPNLQIDILCNRSNREIIKNDQSIDNIYTYDKKPLQDRVLIEKLKANKYDCVVDLLFGDSVTAVIQTALIAGKSFKLAIGKHRYARYYDFSIAAEDKLQPVIERTSQILRLFNIEPIDVELRPKIYLSEKEQKAGSEFIADLRNKYDRLTCINLSAGRPARNWPLEKYAELIKNLHTKYPKTAIILNYSPNEYSKADYILKAGLDRIFPIPRGMKFMEAAGLLSKVDYFISPDTSLHHIAAAFDVPSIIFYPGNDENFTIWQPYNNCIHALRSENYFTVASITPEQISREYENLITETSGESVQ